MIITTTEEQITTITLNRPEKLNAFAGTMREELLAALREAEGRVVVITGAGRAFCAGGDVERMSRLQQERDVDSFRRSSSIAGVYPERSEGSFITPAAPVVSCAAGVMKDPSPSAQGWIAATTRSRMRLAITIFGARAIFVTLPSRAITSTSF